MIRPSPGPATRAATVAVAHTWTTASRTPETISGIATGSSTPRSTCRLAHPHPAGRLDQVVVDPGDRDVGVGDDRRQGEQRQRDQRGQAGPSERPEVGAAHEAQREQREQGDDRDRPADVGDVDRERAAPAAVTEPHGERQARAPSRTASPRA